MIEDTKSKQYFREASKQKIQDKDALKINSLEINFIKEQKVSNDFRVKTTNDINTVAEKISENNDILEKTLKLQSKILSILEQINLNSSTDNFDIPNIPGLSKLKNLKGVGKIGVAAAAAALVALGLYKMSGENAETDFEKSNTALENLEATRRLKTEAVGDIPDPTSPDIQKMNKNEATSLAMSYGLSGDKLNDWLNTWQSKKTNNAEAESPVPATPVVPPVPLGPKTYKNSELGVIIYCTKQSTLESTEPVMVQAIFNLKHLVTFGKCVNLCEELVLFLKMLYHLLLILNNFVLFDLLYEVIFAIDQL